MKLETPYNFGVRDKPNSATVALRVRGLDEVGISGYAACQGDGEEGESDQSAQWKSPRHSHE